MATTKTELARSLGCSKSTVVNCIADLGDVLDGHIQRRGKTDMLDDFAASAIADRLAARFTKTAAREGAEDDLLEVYRSGYRQTLDLLAAIKDAHAEQVADYRARIEVYAQQVEAQQQTIRDMTAEREQTRRAYEDEIERLRSELSRAQAYAAELAAAPWWRKRAVISRYALPAPSDQQGGR